VTATSLITAVTVGLFIGAAGRYLTHRRRSLPLWLSAAAAVGAAVLAVIITGTSSPERQELTAFEVILQVLFAAAGVITVTATADRPPSNDRATR